MSSDFSIEGKDNDLIFNYTDFPAYSDTVYSDTPLSVTLLAIPKPFVTDFPAYSDTGYSDTPVTVTVLTVPKWPFIYKK